MVKYSQGADCKVISRCNAVCLDSRGFFLAPLHVLDGHDKDKKIMEIFMLNIESRKLMRYSSKVSVFSKNSEFDLMILNTEASTQFSTSVLPSSCSIDAHKNVRMSGFFSPDEGGNSSTYEWPGSLGAKKHDGETLVLDVQMSQR